MVFELKPGLVICYDFLWKNEEKDGHTEGRKDRPCLVLAVKEPESAEQYREVLICPITHTPPAQNQTAVEIPYKMAKHLQLDDDRMWIKTQEVNTRVAVPAKTGNLPSLPRC